MSPFAVRTLRHASALAAVLVLPLTASAAPMVPAGQVAGQTAGQHAGASAPADRSFGGSSLAVRTVFVRSVSTARLSPKGTALWRISATSGHDLPTAAERAYRRAAARMGESRPGCGISWWLLAGIGRVESDHGRYDGSVLGDDGVSRPRILGLPLNGVGPVAAIRDTDNGRLDSDRRWDRAVGPMQFIPTTWASVASDGDLDGTRDPDDLDDAALAAAKYLCGSSSLRTESGRRAAVFRYNHSDYYVDLVLAFARGYETGVFVIPSPPVEATPDKAKAPARVRAARMVRVASVPAGPAATAGSSGAKSPVRDPEPKKSAATSPTKSPTKSPTPTKSPSPSPSPSPEPEPVQLTARSGMFTATGAGWSLDGFVLDLGGDARAGQPAAADFDGDGTRETNGAEFEGLADKSVTVQVKSGTAIVYVLAGHDYRGADGSFLGG